VYRLTCMCGIIPEGYQGLFSVSTTTASRSLSRSHDYGTRRLEAARCADHNTGIGRIAEGST